MSIDKDLLDRLMEGRAPGDLFGEEGILCARTIEMDVHLGEERDEGAPEGSDHPSNHRNGSSQKTVTTDSGKVVLDTPAWESAASHPA